MLCCDLLIIKKFGLQGGGRRNGVTRRAGEGGGRFLRMFTAWLSRSSIRRYHFVPVRVVEEMAEIRTYVESDPTFGTEFRCGLTFFDTF